VAILTYIFGEPNGKKLRSQKDRFKIGLHEVSCAKAIFANNWKQELKHIMGYNKEMHKATCADCGKECEVPFKPDGSRPVYCRECYSKRRPPRRY